jgi:hypothetical protein
VLRTFLFSIGLLLAGIFRIEIERLAVIGYCPLVVASVIKAEAAVDGI